MSPSETAPDALESLRQELMEVEWLELPALAPAHERFATIDLLLVVVGAAIGAALYWFARA
ncbi:MAG: hypothetical protein K0V04_30355 [Deltaproteobacteria bacterium]|nr:hypothetical protein [Deltaproteobacteria bacterium]